MNKKLLLSLIVLLGVFCFFFSFQRVRQTVLALSNNYNKTSSAPNNQLSATEWNYLLSDFLAKDGGTIVNGVNNAMQGNLDMAGHQIVNLPDTPSADTNAVNKNFVDSAIGASAGGAVFTNWGNSNCPVGSTKLYDGWGFTGRHINNGGSDNPICIQFGDSDGLHGNLFEADRIYPLRTAADTSQLPPDSSIPVQTLVECAVCYQPGSSCYVNFGSWNCNAAGFSPVYDGYIFGGNYSLHQSTERHCLNRGFGSSQFSSSYAVIAGSVIHDNMGQSGYQQNRFLKCAVCCN